MILSRRPQQKKSHESQRCTKPWSAQIICGISDAAHTEQTKDATELKVGTISSVEIASSDIGFPHLEVATGLLRAGQSSSHSTCVRIADSIMGPAFIALCPVMTSEQQSPKASCFRRPKWTASSGPVPTRADVAATAIAAVVAATAVATLMSPALADDFDVRPQLKISGGSASTSAGARSVIKTVTRGVTLENANFSNADFEGISFQQSILRQADFSNSNLRYASFFDADLSGAKFLNADMAGANLELANMRQADLTGANLSGAFVGSTTKLNGVVIENSDWSDTLLRKDQQQYLCSTAKGTNPITNVDTRESLFCSPE